MKEMKKFLVIIVMLFTLVVMFACSGSKAEFQIGILQYATHDALDSARIGFEESIKNAGFVEGKDVDFIVKNPEGDDSVISTMASSLVRECDLVLGIGTNASTALQTACELEGVDIPVLFTAVTDPVGASLVKNVEKPEANVTGTSDMNPVSAQVDLIKELLPDAKKIGVIYDINEKNSITQANLLKEQAAKIGFTVDEKSFEKTNLATIGTIIQSMIDGGIDALYIPTDNTLAENMEAVTAVTDPAKIVLMCGESSMLEKGGTITYSINYKDLGLLTGEMAVKILKGTKVADIPVGEVAKDTLQVKVNESKLTLLGITLPQSIKDRIK